MMNDEHDNEAQLPAAIVRRLQAQDRSLTVLTPEVDRAVERSALTQFAARKAAARRTVPLWGISAAAAVALAFVVVALREPLTLDRPLPSAAAPAALQRSDVAGDYDGSGAVDVLDAWLLSRNQSANPRFAANDTVASLMQRIVSLDGGER